MELLKILSGGELIFTFIIQKNLSKFYIQINNSIKDKNTKKNRKKKSDLLFKCFFVN